MDISRASALRLKVLNNANIIEKTTGKDNADNKELYTLHRGNAKANVRLAGIMVKCCLMSSDVS